MKQPSARLRRVIIALAMSTALTLLYCSNLRLIAAGDSFPTALVSVSLAVDGTAQLDRFAPWTRSTVPWSRGVVVFAGGHFRSVYPIGQAFLAAPLVAPVAAVLNVRSWNIPRQIYFARLAEKATAAVLTALSVVVVFFALLRITERRWAVALSSVFALGTSSWAISSQALWQQTGGQLCMALAFYYFIGWIRQRDALYKLWLVGCCCALATFIRPTNLVFTVAFALATVWTDRRPRTVLTLGSIPVFAAIANGAYNYSVFGNIFGGYGQFLTPSQEPWTALAGLLISPGRGLLFFSPVLVFSILGAFRRELWNGPDAPVGIACVSGIGAHLAVISFWPIWWGGFTWGWRLLTELGPALVVLMAFAVPVIRSQGILKLTFVALAAVSISVQAVGAYCYPGGGWDAAPYPVDAHRVWNWTDNPISRSAKAGIDRQPYQAVAKLLDPETWTLAHNWNRISPSDLVTVRWWAFPAGSQAGTFDPESFRTAQRRQSGSCHLDVASLQLAEEGSPLSLKVIGWAFDEISGTAPTEIAIKISSPGRESALVPATRWNRPDVAAAFQNGRITPAGVSAEVLLDQPANKDYTVTILQRAADGVTECTPRRPITIEKFTP